MITTAMSAVIEAEPRCVWRALTDPDELCTWDENLLAPVDPPSGYPCVEAPQRWRYLLHGVQVLLHERPLEVSVERRLQSSLAMGGMKLEQTYSLAPENAPFFEPNSSDSTRFGGKAPQFTAMNGPERLDCS